MKPHVGAIAIAAPILVTLVAVGQALTQKAGGILRMYNPDSLASMSIHEEATIVSERPMMGVFNNLVMFDQHVKQNSLQSIEACRYSSTTTRPQSTRPMTRAAYARNREQLIKRRVSDSELARLRVGEPERVAYGPAEIERLGRSAPLSR
jgi:hypothetical protein